MTNTALATKSVAQFLEIPAVKARIADTLKSEKAAAAFASTLVSITQNNKLLANAEPKSVVSSAMKATLLDLPIDPSLGFAHIVPYAGKAQFQMGYKGFIQLAQRSGKIRKLNDVVIPKGVFQSYDPVTGDIDLDWTKEDMESEEADGYLVYLELTNGFSKTVYWSEAKVRAHAKRYSQAYSKGYDTPWKTDFDAMALKTVIKFMLGRYAPLSVHMQDAIISDGASVNMDGKVTDYPDHFTTDEQETKRVDGTSENVDKTPQKVARKSAKKRAEVKESGSEGETEPDSPPVKEEKKPEPPVKEEKKEEPKLPPTIADLAKEIYFNLTVNKIDRETYHTYLRGLEIMESKQETLHDLSSSSLSALLDQLPKHLEDLQP